MTTNDTLAERGEREITQEDRERANAVGGLTMERRAIVAEEFAKHRIAARNAALEGLSMPTDALMAAVTDASEDCFVGDAITTKGLRLALAAAAEHLRLSTQPHTNEGD